MIVVAGSLAVSPAFAYDLRQTAQGKPIRWQAERVAFAVDPGIEKAIPGARSVIMQVIDSWSERSGAPVLAITFAQTPLKAAVDGVNAVLVAPPGFAAIGSALAITLTSYDEASGAILDTDIVINAENAFAILGQGARAKLGAPHVPTDDAPHVELDGGVAHAFGPFDFQHVFAHEIGHALGLGDSDSSPYALMYAYTLPGDASVRVPASDDVDGVAAQYGPPIPHQSEGGCSSSVSGSRSKTDGRSLTALAFLFGAFVATRRARVLVGARIRSPIQELKRKTR
jgi:hypothetical protein